MVIDDGRQIFSKSSCAMRSRDRGMMGTVLMRADDQVEPTANTWLEICMHQRRFDTVSYNSIRVMVILHKDELILLS